MKVDASSESRRMAMRGLGLRFDSICPEKADQAANRRAAGFVEAIREARVREMAAVFSKSDLTTNRYRLAMQFAQSDQSEPIA
jgi:hypothetical protein